MIDMNVVSQPYIGYTVSMQEKRFYMQHFWVINDNSINNEEQLTYVSKTFHFVILLQMKWRYCNTDEDRRLEEGIQLGNG